MCSVKKGKVSITGGFYRETAKFIVYFLLHCGKIYEHKSPKAQEKPKERCAHAHAVDKPHFGVEAGDEGRK